MSQFFISFYLRPAVSEFCATLQTSRPTLVPLFKQVGLGIPNDPTDKTPRTQKYQVSKYPEAQSFILSLPSVKIPPGSKFVLSLPSVKIPSEAQSFALSLPSVKIPPEAQSFVLSLPSVKIPPSPKVLSFEA